tara:strand:+ start:873 stop:1319 length:447 start_codon:yes stop_codon:yes gene_type:complete
MKQREKLNLIDALRVGGTILLSALTAGCAGTKYGGNKDYATMNDAMTELNVASPAMISSFPNGYKTSMGLEGNLRNLAGIFAGTIDVMITKYENGYKVVTDGVYSQFEHPEAMNSVLRLADENNDKIITREEVKELQDSIYQYLMEKE